MKSSLLIQVLIKQNLKLNMNQILKQIAIQIIAVILIMFGFLSLLYGATGQNIFTVIGSIIICVPAQLVWIKQLNKLIKRYE